MEVIELHIAFDQPTGHVQVTGPVANKLLCFGILELAKEVIREYKPQQGPGLTIAKALPANLNGGKA